MVKTYIETRYIKPMSEHYFFVEDLSGEENTLSIVKNNNWAPTVTVEYSTDEQNWQTLGTTGNTALTLTVPANGRVYLRANTNSWGTGGIYQNYFNSITATGNYSVGGNILSLLYGSSFAGQTVVPSGSTTTFVKLFQRSTTLVKADNLVLPEIIPDYGLLNIFSGCSALTGTIDLSNVTTIGDYGMYQTFSGCSALTGTIDLSNVTTIGNNGMFNTFGYCNQLQSCSLSSLNTVGSNGMQALFQICSSLNSVDIRSMTTWDTNNTGNWLYSVAATGTIYINPALDGVIPENSTSGIPSGWTKVVVNP